MTKPNITTYLQKDSKTLGSLLTKINLLNQWNTYLRESLEEETNLRDHCRIVNLSGNTLIMLADSSAWVTRLRFLVPDLLPRLHQYPSFTNVQTISCKVSPVVYLRTKKHTRNKIVLSSPTADLIKDTASKIRHEALRKALERIASHK